MAFILGMFLLSYPQDKTQDPALEERVQRLVKDLADADIGIRDSATRKFLELGESAVPSLQRSLNASNDAEVKARIKDILAKLEKLPLEAVKAYCQDRLEGTYSPEFNYDRQGCGEIRSPLLKKWIPDLVFFQAWGKNMEPSRRILLGFHRKSKEVVPISSWAHLKKYVNPATKEGDIQEVAAVVAQLSGTCLLCGIREISPAIFQVQKKESGYQVEGRYEHKATETVLHAVYSWTLEFDSEGRIVSFVRHIDFKTKHQ